MIQRPHVTLKLATSLDGRIATPSGESRWITGSESRAATHGLRAQASAVMIGAGTARADDPELTVRDTPAPNGQPLRVVIDTRFSLPLQSRLVETLGQAPLLVIGAEAGERRSALEAAGVATEIAAAAADGVDAAAALSALAMRGVTRVFVEGGGRLAASLLKTGAVDLIEWFRAPIVLGADGVPAVAALALARLADAPTYRRVALRELGPDLWESYERA